MKRLLFALALLSTPAFAADAPKPISLSATPEELQALDTLLDLATKSGGLAVANNALAWHNKLVQAVADAAKPEPTAPPLASDKSPSAAKP